MVGVKADLVALAGGATPYHKAVIASAQEVGADATDAATAVVLANSLKSRVNVHLASEGSGGVHAAASAESVDADDATDQATAITLANEIKADFNTHLSESGVHLNDDSTNAVSSADATDEGSLVTLVNEIKADYNAHIADGLSSGLIG